MPTFVLPEWEMSMSTQPGFRLEGVFCRVLFGRSGRLMWSESIPKCHTKNIGNSRKTACSNACLCRNDVARKNFDASFWATRFLRQFSFNCATQLRGEHKTGDSSRDPRGIIKY